MEGRSQKNNLKMIPLFLIWHLLSDSGTFTNSEIIEKNVMDQWLGIQFGIFQNYLSWIEHKTKF